MIGTSILLFFIVIFLIRRRRKVKKEKENEEKKIVVNNDNIVINNDYTSEYLDDDAFNDFENNINYEYTVNQFNGINEIDNKSDSTKKEEISTKKK